MQSIRHVVRPMLLAAAGALAGCAALESAREPAVTRPEPPVPPAAAPAPVPEKPRAKLAKPGPIPTRPLNAAADCAFRDEDGYRGSLRLKVTDARVHRFEAEVTIPRHGVCRFDLKDFRQSTEMPNVTLTTPGSRCAVRMWEQGHRVTVAFTDCQRQCSGSAWERLWPILADNRNGSCG